MNSRKRELKGFLFLLPSLIGAGIFWMIPFGDVVRRSFFSAVSGTFTGWKNYATVMENQAFRLAAGNTLRFFAVCIPILVVLSLLIAVLLTKRKRGMQLLKSMFLLPMAIPVASVVILWKVLFHDQGLLNHLLSFISVSGTDWMNTDASFGVLVFSYIWRNLGYDIVLWAAGLGSIPGALYDAARVDGAGEWKCFFSINASQSPSRHVYDRGAFSSERLQGVSGGISGRRGFILRTACIFCSIFLITGTGILRWIKWQRRR